MYLNTWAQRWNIPSQALDELKQSFGFGSIQKENGYELSEQAVQNLVRLEATKKGCRLWRNNVGAAYMQDGAFIRYGLANESSALNRQIKSADLIGIRPIKITPSMIGFTFGQFVSREIKASNWKFSGSERELAQLRWAELILSYGGDACFANKEGTL